MKIAIVGYGVEGRSNYRYYRAKYPEAEIVIFDERAQLDDTPEGAQLVLGGRAFAQVKGFDLVLRSRRLRRIGLSKLTITGRRRESSCAGALLRSSG